MCAPCGPRVKASNGRAVSLALVAQDSKACHSFRRYIQEAYKDDMMRLHPSNPEKVAMNARDAAANYLQFWLDASGEPHPFRPGLSYMLTYRHQGDQGTAKGSNIIGQKVPIELFAHPPGLALPS
jgi:hypothetical protein